ncbi:hypothetical protein ACFSSC_03170 [Corynebacterium mendelii]|uniref:Uncharacterized protein n=1 Tax=Corynebacterium mendelii TaxID=2765362 RepID=A0A939E2H7_9CORY|nr:hypothetical protein [Corynebacterium mendelii]MBN9644277.1 hypothetical protein [Corynebacterium mendelii]
MKEKTCDMPVAVSRLEEDVERSREPQIRRAAAWLLQQPGGAVTVVTPTKKIDSKCLETLIGRSSVRHLSWRNLASHGLSGRVLLAWPNRDCLDSLWRIELDALAVIEWDPRDTQEWFVHFEPSLLLHDRVIPFERPLSPQLCSERVPKDVWDFLESIATWAEGYSTGLKWNEVAKLKSDMMLCPQRWEAVSVEQLRSCCVELGMRPKDVDTVARLLERRKKGHRFSVPREYKGFRFS